MAFIKNTNIFGCIEGFGSVAHARENLLDFLWAFRNYDVETASLNIIGRTFQLEPNTTYILSTNAPETITGSGSSSCLLWLISGAVINKISKANHGAWSGSPRRITTESDGILTVAMRAKDGDIVLTEEDIASGKYWARLEKV